MGEELQVSVDLYLPELLYYGIAVLRSVEQVFKEVKRRVVLLFMVVMADESHKILAQNAGIVSFVLRTLQFLFFLLHKIFEIRQPLERCRSCCPVILFPVHEKMSCHHESPRLACLLSLPLFES